MSFIFDETRTGLEGRHVPARGARIATPEARAVARRVTSALESCLAIPDHPELSYLRCFVRMAFEEASALGTQGHPSEEDLAYLDRLQDETRGYRAHCKDRPVPKTQRRI